MAKKTTTPPRKGVKKNPPKVWKITNELRNVHCILHPRSDWFYVPYVDSNGKPIKLYNGIKEILCATCLIPTYESEHENQPTM